MQSSGRLLAPLRTVFAWAPSSPAHAHATSRTLMQSDTSQARIKCKPRVSLSRSVCETFLQAGMWTWGHSSLGSSAPSRHDAVFWKYVCRSYICAVCMFVQCALQACASALCSPSMSWRMFLWLCSSSLFVSCSSMFVSVRRKKICACARMPVFKCGPGSLAAASEAQCSSAP